MKINENTQHLSVSIHGLQEIQEIMEQKQIT
jgi:hypothetical protein